MIVSVQLIKFAQVTVDIRLVKSLIKKRKPFFKLNRTKPISDSSAYLFI